MAASFTLYNSFLKYVGDGTIDLDTDTLKLCLVTSSYTPDVTHDVLADVLASPSPEVEQVDSPDNGYTTGGVELTTVSLTLSDSPAQCVLDADDVIWTSLTATFRYGILYVAKSISPIENPLIGYILYDTTPDDVTVSGVNFSSQWSASGIVKYSKG